MLYAPSFENVTDFFLSVYFCDDDAQLLLIPAVSQLKSVQVLKLELEMKVHLSWCQHFARITSLKDPTFAALGDTLRDIEEFRQWDDNAMFEKMFEG